ncbi:uncharacterized protein [Embiotoca jacksoni]|uniref:uncharacterized protein n=1 Tax=Embiotoca jacksoni TaxID=100190 RepID=UPI003704150D
MHSVAIDSSGSPKKRTFSRGISEDESLRSIIKETESSSRRLTRSDSRAGTLKRRSDSQSEQDLFMGLPEMLELQASYDEAVQEVRGLEVERETLLFQVDVLQDTLEGVEELLAEAQREAGQAASELERERDAKRKLESMVCSLRQEVERLTEERNNKPPAPVNTTDEPGHQINTDAEELIHATHREDSSLCEPRSNGGPAAEGGPADGAEDVGGVQAKPWRMVSKSPARTPSLALDNHVSVDGVLRRPYENGVEDRRDPSPDRDDSDSISAYEDASAEIPEQDRVFPGDGDALELPDDSEDREKSPTNNRQADGETQDPKNPDACVLS